MPFTDKTLTCQDCGQQFTFSADDQEFYGTKGYSEPKRCPTCRAARKSERGDSGGRGYSSDRQMHAAVCGDCGKNTEVPFEPRGDRPVYCRDCFSKRTPARSRY
jgi:CxxC-x17-CxxC domain-containing protein